jgi:SAM-dependent methyltransferase
LARRIRLILFIRCYQSLAADAWLCLWLSVKGVNAAQWEKRALEAARVHLTNPEVNTMSLRFHEIAEKNHRILNPFTAEKLMLLGEVCRLEPGKRQLDLACGKGEMLCRWAERFGIAGSGVDISTVFVEAARQRADELGVASQVDFIVADAAKFQSEAETYDIVSCIGASWIGGGTRGTLELLKRQGLKPGPDSLILMGEVFWRAEPSAEALAAMGVQPGEWAVGLEGVLEMFEASGTCLVEMSLATDTEWDRYESKHWWVVERWMRENAHDPEYDQLVAFARKSRLDYFRYVRPLCDWGVFVLRVK